MCKHFPEAQVAVRTACCKKFYDCPQCHAENEDHPLQKTLELAMICKKCRRAFRKNLTDFDPETDSFCPHCDNEFVLASTAATTEHTAAVASQDLLPSSQPDPLAGLDARMIRDNDVNDADFGFDNLAARLG